MSTGYTFKRVTVSEIGIIKPLWNKLNDIHYNDSVHFKEHFASFTFEKRIAHFAGCDEHSIMIEIAEANDGSLVGYCISTIGSNGIGELDSLFVEEGSRGNKIGGTMVRNSIDWLQKQGCSKIRVAVAHGHESVLPFYRIYGFLPRLTYLEMIDKDR